MHRILPTRSAQDQRGAALLLLLLLLLVGAGVVFVSQLKSSAVELEAQRKTEAALAEAKQALLGYAASDANRPGSLPCPDANNDGEAKVPDDYSGSGCVAAVGRLPWKTLGLPDLRDGKGQRLWYAVSPKFASNNPVSLNSAVLGEITLKDAQGNVLYDATGTSGLVAVIIAPAEVLTRQGLSIPQDRTCVVGTNCSADQVCTAAPFATVPICNPVNYLDVSVTPSEDNASFSNGTLDGFIDGPVLNPADSAQKFVNDRVMGISQSELFYVVKRRIFAEVRGSAVNTPNCLSSSSPTGLAGYAAVGGFLPWAATTIGGNGISNTYIGYLPAADLTFAKRDSYCQWDDVILGNNWAGYVKYTVSPAYAPGGSRMCGMGGSNCLVVNGVPNAKAKVTVDGTDFGIW